MQTLVKETNLITHGHFKVIRETRVVDDPPVYMTISRQIHRKRVELYQLKTRRLKVLKLVQYYQLVALTTEDDKESQTAVDYVQDILKPELAGINVEYSCLEREIQKLEALKACR